MVGDWRQASEGTRVTASCKWDLGEQYLLWTYEVKGDDRESLPDVDLRLTRVGARPAAGSGSR